MSALKNGLALAALCLLALAGCRSDPPGKTIDSEPARTGGRSASTGGQPPAPAGTGGTVAGTGGGGPAATGGAAVTPGTGGSAGETDAMTTPPSGGDAPPSPPAASGYRFGARPQAYPPGSIKPTGEQGALDAVVKGAYDKWKAAYVMAACEGYIVKSGGSELTSSSALGTGMIITAMLAGHDPEAQKIFDGLFSVGRKFPSVLGIRVPAKHGIPARPNNTSLPAYAVAQGCRAVNEGDSSVNGDLDFAYGLLLADKQWGSAGTVNYLEEAKKTINAIKSYDMTAGKLPLIGDWASLPGEGAWTTHTKPANFMVGHLRAFAKASGDMFWMQSLDAVHAAIADTQTRHSPMTGLFPQYLMAGRNLPGARVLPSDRNARDFFDEVSYLPLRFAADLISSGDARTKTALTKIHTWIKGVAGGDPGKIVDGYRLEGAPIGTMGTMAFIAPFATLGIFDAANQAWIDAAWKLMAAAPTTSRAADTANLLGLLILSGNWWQP